MKGGAAVRRVLAVTGTRADYGILRPVFRAIQAHPALELGVLVTGMHLASEFGLTVREIERDGFPIAARVDMLLAGDTGGAMAKSLGIGLIGMTQAIEALQPDIVLVLGDRGESLAAAIAAVHLNIPVAHLHGGEVTCGGMVDDVIRWAITDFAHLHLPTTPGAAERLVRRGEAPWRVHVVGAPGLDAALATPLTPREVLARTYGLEPDRPWLLAVQHPVTAEAEQAGKQMVETMEALAALGLPTVLIYPNADAGSGAMIEVIQRYRLPHVRVFPSLPSPDYLSLLKEAAALVGNSSSGIIEAPSLGTPAVNIGTRQAGRERGDNVLDVGYDRDEIVAAVRRALHDEDFRRLVSRRRNPYGDGRAAPRIAQLLAEVPLDGRLLRKGSVGS